MDRYIKKKQKIKRLLLPLDNISPNLSLLKNELIGWGKKRNASFWLEPDKSEQVDTDFFRGGGGCKGQFSDLRSQ